MITRFIAKNACIRIQKEWRKFKSRIDPISMEPVRKKFVIVRNKCSHIYDADNLIQYIVSSGDFNDPIARQTYDSCELCRLCIATNQPKDYLDMRKKSLIQRRDDLLALSALCDLFEQDIVEQLELLRSMDDDSIFMGQIFPQIIDSFENLRMLNISRCRIFMRDLWQRFLTEPLERRDINTKVMHLLSILFNHCR